MQYSNYNIKSLQIGLLTNTPDKIETRLITDAAKKFGHQILILLLDSVCLSSLVSSNLDAFDIIIARIDIDSLSNESFQHANRIFNYLGNQIPVLNDGELLRKCQDKFETDICLKKVGLPVPDSLATLSKQVARKAIDAMCIKYQQFVPLIFKPIYGCRGDGIQLAGTYHQASQIIDSLPENEPIYFQRFFEKTGNRDLRIIIHQGIIFGAITRIAKDNDVITNTSKGSRCGFLNSLPKRIVKIAQKASFAIGKGVLGLDIGITSEEIYIWEVNACPDFALHKSDNMIPKYPKQVEDFIIGCAEIEYLNFFNKGRQGSNWNRDFTLSIPIDQLPYQKWIHEFISI